MVKKVAKFAIVFLLMFSIFSSVSTEVSADFPDQEVEEVDVE